jgi:hypothetical protein
MNETQILSEPGQQLGMCKALIDAGVALTDWEDEFLSKVMLLLSTGVRLSPPQHRKLQQICEERL